MKKLRVNHFPQILCEPFEVPVKDLEEARKIMGTLADYDYFQYDNKIKPDYSNVTILEQWNEEDQEWEDWYDEETGIDDVVEYLEFISE